MIEQDPFFKRCGFPLECVFEALNIPVSNYQGQQILQLATAELHVDGNVSRYVLIDVVNDGPAKGP